MVIPVMGTLKLVKNKITGEIGFWFWKKGRSIFMPLKKLVGPGFSAGVEAGVSKSYLPYYARAYNDTLKKLAKYDVNTVEDLQGIQKVTYGMYAKYYKTGAGKKIQHMLDSWKGTSSYHNPNATFVKYLDNSVRNKKVPIRMSKTAHERLRAGTKYAPGSRHGGGLRPDIYMAFPKDPRDLEELKTAYAEMMGVSHALLRKTAKDGRTLLVHRGVQGRTGTRIAEELRKIQDFDKSNITHYTIKEETLISASTNKGIAAGFARPFGNHEGFWYSRRVPISQTGPMMTAGPRMDRSLLEYGDFEGTLEDALLLTGEREILVRGGTFQVPLTEVHFKPAPPAAVTAFKQYKVMLKNIRYPIHPADKAKGATMGKIRVWADELADLRGSIASARKAIKDVLRMIRQYKESMTTVAGKDSYNKWVTTQRDYVKQEMEHLRRMLKEEKALIATIKAGGGHKYVRKYIKQKQAVAKAFLQDEPYGMEDWI